MTAVRWLLVLGVTVLVAACGEPVATEPGGGTQPGEATEPPTDPGTTELVIAPDCAELDAERLRAYDTGEQPSLPATPEHSPTDHEPIVRWAQEQAGDDFGGVWIEPPGTGQLTVAFVGDVDAYREALHERFGDHVRVVEAERSEAELDALQEEITEDMRAGAGETAADRYRPPPGTIVMSGRMTSLGRVSVGVVGGDDAALAEVTQRYGAERVCLEVLEPPPPMEHDGPVRPLAKVDGWRDGLDTDVYALVEIAYDAQTAERAWRENVPEGLPEREPEGDPVDEGVYGHLDDVDFSTHALVVWSAGQSGSCPGWVADIDTGDGGVVLEEGAAGVGGCTGDYNPYRMVLAVERDRLPAEDSLPQEARLGQFVAGEVTAYPVSDSP